MNLRNRLLATAGAVLLVATTTFTGSAQVLSSTADATVAITSAPGVNFLSVNIASATLEPRAYSLTPQSTTGFLVVTVTDTRGTAAGWSVYLRASDFTDTITSEFIPIENLSLAAGTVSGNNAGSISPSGINEVSASGQLILQAEVGEGTGTVANTMEANLDIPADTLVGTYTSQVNVSFNSAP